MMEGIDGNIFAELKRRIDGNIEEELVYQYLTSASPADQLEKADQFVQATQKLVSLTFARPDDLTMPELGQKLLPFILPKKLRAAVAGDLAEDFRTFATKWGRPYALRWLWWELSGLFIRRFGPTAIITAVGMWFRQKLGW
jgi:hypothetical protein